MENINDYSNIILQAVIKLDQSEDWGLDLDLFKSNIPQINEILNQEGIEERSADEWERMILESEDGEEIMNLQIAQSVLEM